MSVVTEELYITALALVLMAFHKAFLCCKVWVMMFHWQRLGCEDLGAQYLSMCAPHA